MLSIHLISVTRGLDDAIVIDLHAEQILDTTAGMNAGDILEYQLKIFRDTIKQYAGHKGQKLIFIHGKGAGVFCVGLSLMN